MLTPCNNCPNFDWCKRHGCTTWNDESRALKKRDEKAIAELEKMFHQDVK